MKKGLLILLFALVVMGLVSILACKKPEPIVTVQRVEIPVAVPCPAPPALPRPVSAVATLPKDATPSMRAKALLADLASWVGYALEEEQILNGYRPAPESGK